MNCYKTWEIHFLYATACFDCIVNFISCFFCSSVQICYFNSDMQIFDRVRGHDIRLLKQYNVGFILDLMLEQKKVKFGMKLVIHKLDLDSVTLWVIM
jgi:hypothetical protein